MIPTSTSPLAGLLVVALALAACTDDRRAEDRRSDDRRAESDTAFLSIVLNTMTADEDLGFTTVDVTPVQLSELSTDQAALVWLGGYDQESCRLESSDDEIRRQFADHRLADDPRVLGYFLADEPDRYGRCPGAPTQIRARAALVRSLDPDPERFTLVNVDDPDFFASFRDTADVLSTDPYPCRVGQECDWSLIPEYIDRLREAGVTRYMGMLQAFAGDGWRWPTAGELERMIEAWRESDWCGALIFSWEYSGGRLSDHPELLAVLRSFNEDRPDVPEGCT